MGPEISTGRNSKLRQFASVPTNFVAEHLVDLGITADEVTIAGGIGRIATALWALSENKKPKDQKTSPWVMAGVATIFALFDAVDGAVAREQQKRGAPASNHGAQLDGVVDSAVIVVDYLTQANLCHQKKDYFGELTAYLAALTSRLPAIARKEAELHGKSVSEFDKKFPLGNHVGRSAAAIVVDSFPDTTKLNVAVVASNIGSALNRWQVAGDEKQPKTLAPEEQQKANSMKKLYLATLIATGVVVVSNALINRHRVK